ncbi:MAG: excinuclease ABC subunit UvrA, partial [Cryobacterium sp.]
MTTVADSHDVIQVRGARENNLRDISLDLPKRRLTVFTGVSGSGKSSLVFGTIAAESQRMINETYSAFLQTFMGSPSRPDVDSLHNLSAAIVVDQERMGANSRSTLGTATDAYTLLRIVFSRIGVPSAGSALAYSFNGEGMCPNCEGLGKVSSVDIDGLVDRDKSINSGAITVPNFSVDGWYVKGFAESGFFDSDKPLRDFSEREWADFLHRPATKIKVNGINTSYEGLVVKVQRMYL